MKRQRRNIEAKKKLDLNVPINIEMLGTDDDPCFGKLHDPRATECGRCGDAEICAIVMGQKNHIKRIAQEKKGNFKDMEELNIKSPDRLVLRKSIRNRIREMVKMDMQAGVDINEVVNDVYATYGKDGYGPKKIRKIINNMLENSNYLILTKNRLLWKRKS